MSVLSATSKTLCTAARELSVQVGRLKFRPPVAYVYNPLDYAWDAHEEYLRRFGQGRKKIIFLGMNPGPFGMAQIGIPFGEIAAARDWMGIHTRINKPACEHPKRPVEGFACARSEVSGRRLWGLFAARFGSAPEFFAEHFVSNYCPLAFLAETGRNLTPDKLPAAEQARLFAACDEHLEQVLRTLDPEWLIGVGGFARAQSEEICARLGIKLGQILHPSPASPAANRGWAEAATKQLQQLKIWKSER